MFVRVQTQIVAMAQDAIGGPHVRRLLRIRLLTYGKTTSYIPELVNSLGRL